MANKITYGDKVAVLPQTTHINQFWAEDANELKNKHNLNDDRTTAIEDNIVLLEAGQTGGFLSFTTLALLQAYPTPSINDSFKVTNDDILSSNNGYYHWTGSAYVKDANLANGIISSGNVDAVSGDTVYKSFLEITKNLFDKDNVVDGFYLNTGNGSLIPNATYSTSNYMIVEELTDYICNSTYTFICYFNSSKVRIGGDALGGRSTFTTPADCAYVRVSETTTLWDLNTLQFEQGIATTSYIQFTYNRIDELEEIKANHGYTDLATSKTLKAVDDEVVILNNGFDNFTLNLFDKTTITEGIMNTGNGQTIQAVVGTQTSAYIPVTEGEIYKRSQEITGNYYFRYDSSYNYLGFQYSTIITIPVGCAFIKVSYLSVNIDTMMFVTVWSDTSIYRSYNGAYLIDSYLQNPLIKANADDTEDFKELAITRETTDNLFNKLDSNVAFGAYFKTDGITYNNIEIPSLSTSGFIAVTEGETYKKAGEASSGFIYQYDADKKPYSTPYVNATSITIPVGVSYVRVVFTTANIDKLVFCLSSVLATTYIPFTKQTLGDYVSLPKKTKIDKVAWWLGDSITAGSFGDAYLPYLNEQLIFKEQYEIAVSGATWSHTATTSSISGNTIYNQVVNMIDLVTTSSYEIPEVIFISCGTNDISRALGTPTDVYDDLDFISLSANDSQLQNVSGGIRYVCDTILTEYPDVQIILIAPIQRGDSINNPTVKAIKDTIIECGSLGSMEVIDAYSKCGIYGYFDIATNKYLDDNLHPNTAGANKLANFLFKALKNIIIE